MAARQGETSNRLSRQFKIGSRTPRLRPCRTPPTLSARPGLRSKSKPRGLEKKPRGRGTHPSVPQLGSAHAAHPHEIYDSTLCLRLISILSSYAVLSSLIFAKALMPTQFHLDASCGDVMNMSLNDDEDGDVPSKGGGSSNEIAGSGTKHKSILLN
ncbi:hypothetical protein Cgig2_016396 [Carnegiea gigantea]|uniref:Uncharacterized protein n=1 Tax=Carnegiea gigantea TaxID=171969 RepID=A0A9Q1K856_9CARY|nr:hypothetical protein Cgig2_016396 [Carnegiea gigantea]